MAALFVGCSRNTIYSHYEHTPINGWEKNDELHFTIGPFTEDGAVKQQVGLRTNDEYPFTSLTLIIDQQVLPSGYWRSDTLDAQLVTPEGSVKGKGINYYQYTFSLPHFTLRADDTLYVTVRHDMKREILPGIADVGITIERP